MNTQVLVIVGPPGSGKSAIGRQLSTDLGGIYISSGDIARELAKIDTNTADSLARGGLANEMAMRTQIQTKIVAASNTANMIVLDGFPRFYDQYLFLKSITNSEPIIILVDTDLEVCGYRLSQRKRNDDILSIIVNRFEKYNEVTLPMIRQISPKIVVNGNQALQDVVFDIKKAIQ